MLLNTTKNVSFKAVICRGKDEEGKEKHYWFPDNSDCIINKHSQDNYHIYNPKSQHPVETVKDLVIDLIDNGSIVHYTETVNSKKPLIIDKISNKVDNNKKIALLYKNNSSIEFINKNTLDRDDTTSAHRKSGINFHAKARASIYESGENCFINLYDNSKANLHNNEGDVDLHNNSIFEIIQNKGTVTSKNDSIITLEKNRGLLFAKDKSCSKISENFEAIAIKDCSHSEIVNNTLNGKILIKDDAHVSILNNKSGSIIIPQNKSSSSKRTIHVNSNYHSGVIRIGDKNNAKEIKNNDDISVYKNNGYITLYAPGRIAIDEVQANSEVIAHGSNAIVDIKKLADNIQDKKNHVKTRINLLEGASPGKNLQELIQLLIKPKIIAKHKQ